MPLRLEPPQDTGTCVCGRVYPCNLVNYKQSDRPCPACGSMNLLKHSLEGPQG